MRIAALSILLSGLLASSAWSAPRTYQTYPYDGKPIDKHGELGKEWKELAAQWKDKVPPEAVLKRQLELIEAISALEPNWVDGLWQAADASFQYGNTMTDPKDFPKARALFAKGKSYSDRCLRIQPENPLCKFYLGVNVGKMASIDGIFASLKNAKLVERMWVETTESPYNHQFSEKTSLQGASRYALGMFYRLVPDFFLMKWLFDVKGDINKSVAYHRENLHYDSPNVCSKTMFAVSLVCEGKSDFSTPSGQQGLAQLREAKTLPVTSAVLAMCAKDLPRLEQNPKLACGYETTRQQETSEEEFKKQNKETAANH